jgi:hypothetical protein
MTGAPFEDITDNMLPGLLSADKVKPKMVEWMWYPYFPANQISIVGAKGGPAKDSSARRSPRR